jgi:3-oxoacyl-[acyl-carrier-protein] synthase-1
MGAPLAIVGLGASTPIGRNVWASAAAARAGVCGFAEHPFMIDTAGEPMRIARVPWLGMEIEGAERYAALLVPAIHEALAMALAGLGSQGVKLGVAIALPPDRPGAAKDLGDEVLRAVAASSPGLFADSRSFALGHAAGHLALEAVVASANHGGPRAWIVAGVDSYHAPETLEWIEACDQLHGGGPLNNAWGFIPGEGAGAMLVCDPGLARAAGLETLGEMIAVGIGREENLIKTDSVCIGEGLTQAFRAALAPLAPDEVVHNVFCDLNGETYRADEYGFAALRTGERFRAATDFVAPADCWGDVGAAGMPLHVALAVISQRKRYGKGPLSMVWASSESGERGATLIRGIDARGS